MLPIHGEPLGHGSNQFLDRLDAGIDQVMRPPLRVLHLRFLQIDAAVVIQGGEDFLEFHGPLNHFRTQPVG